MMIGFDSLLRWVRQRFVAIGCWLQRLIGKAHDLWGVLMPCRFSILMMLAVGLFLLCSGQGRDTLREFIESWAYEPTYLWQQAFFLFAALAWASSCWYFAGLMLSFQFPNSPAGTAGEESIRQPVEDVGACHSLEIGDDSFRAVPNQPTEDAIEQPDWIRRCCIWVPRILGTVCLLLISIAHVVAAYPYDQSTDPSTKATLFWLAGFYFLLAALFFLFTWQRRPWLQKVYQWLHQVVEGSARLLQSVVELFNATPLTAETYFYRTRLPDLRSQDMVWIIIYAALAVGLFVGFVFYPVHLGQFLGTSTILLFAAGGWIVFGSLMVYLGSRFRVPILTVMLMLAVGFSSCNDNHDIRNLETNGMSSIERRPLLSERFDLWLKAMDARYGSHVKHPLIVVAAEGGGIRAAYWTALVLTELQDRNDAFAEHVFALSGVSGGSLGSAVFAALVAEQTHGSRSLVESKSPNGRTSMLTRAQAMLEEDFLGPVVGKLLYPDLVQRFFPFPLSCFDRALALEEAWEHAWANVVSTGENRFRKDFLALWPPNDALRVPALFLNATWVEAGKRIIISNVRISSQVPDAVDFHGVIGKDIPLSTAVHMSARFTYVSPAGTLKELDATGKAKTWGHVVDGGYFENSGAATAYDILWFLSQERKVDWHRVKPVIVLITNNPKEPLPWDDPTAEKTKPAGWLGEISSPIRALLMTREARGTYSQAAVGTLPDGEIFRFGLRDNRVPLPLGWQLSRCACREMRSQLDGGCGICNNSEELGRLNALITGKPQDHQGAGDFRRF
jgi:hypothetical protein